MQTLIKQLTILSFISLFLPTVWAENELSIRLPDNNDITVEQYPAKGPYLVLWIAPGYGLRKTHQVIAQELSQRGIEVWQADILESLFMQHSSTNIKKLDGAIIRALMEQAYRKTGKKIILAGDSYASISVLKGARQWQLAKHSQPYFIGAILFSPYMYKSIPTLGQLPEYMPIVSATNIPLMIYQARKHGNTGQFKRLLGKLQQHGNPVFSRMTPKMMSVFYQDKVDANAQLLMQKLAGNIRNMISVLEKYPVPKTVIPLAKVKIKGKGLDTRLKPYSGTAKPLPIRLGDTNGKIFQLNDYHGQVTVVNFWASWCPPCVKEIPSLNRLKQKMAGKPFQLISINYAEDRNTILNFMKKVKVEFPVLIDENGDFARKWNVIAFPSTFIIDPQGQIRYGVNAAVEWDTEEITEKISQLLE